MSESLTWCIRWETEERLNGLPLFGGTLPDRFESRHAADFECWRLTRTHPRRYSPFYGGIPKAVRYAVVARWDDAERSS